MRIGVVVIMVGICLIVAFLWQFGDVGSRRGSIRQVKPGHVVAELEAARGEVVRDRAAQARSTRSPSEARTEQARRLSGDSGGPAVVRGRFLLPGGDPARGVELLVRGWDPVAGWATDIGVAPAWEDLRATTNVDGRFQLRFEALSRLEYILSATSNGFADLTWRWSDIADGTVKDLGDIELVAGGTIVARVLDSEGSPIRTGCYARIESDAPVPGSRFSKYVNPNESTGEMRFDGVPEGNCRVFAFFYAAEWFDGPKLEVQAGEVRYVDFPYVGPDLSSRIRVLAQCEPFYPLRPERQHVRLIGSDMKPIAPTAADFMGLTFDGLEPGLYSVVIEDPRFVPFREDGVRTGLEVARVPVKGRCTIRLTVLDERTGDPIRNYGVSATLLDVSFRPSAFALVRIGAAPPEGGLLEGLVPMNMSLIVTAPGYAETTQYLGTLNPERIEEITVRLRGGVSITGRVLQADGRTPAQNAVVGLFCPEAEDVPKVALDHSELPYDPPWMWDATRITTTDSAGRFSFGGVAPGQIQVCASVGPQVDVVSERLALAAGESREGLVLRLPAQHSFYGRVLGPPGASYEGLLLTVFPTNRGDSIRFEDPLDADLRISTTSIERDGSYRVEGLPSGEAHVLLRSRQCRVRLSEDHTITLPGFSRDVGSVQIRPTGDTAWDLDLRDDFPGFIDVEVRVNGTPAPGLTVQAVDLEYREDSIDEAEWTRGPGLTVQGLEFQATEDPIDAAAWNQDEALEEESAEKQPEVDSRWAERAAYWVLDPAGACGTTDTSGRARIGPLFPGSWTVSARSIPGRWTWEHQTQVGISSAQVVQCHVEIDLVEGTLLVVDEEGSPTVGTQIRWSHSSAPESGNIARTDGNGQISLAFPPGRVELHSVQDAESSERVQPWQASVDWTLEGPVPMSLVVSRSD